MSDEWWRGAVIYQIYPRSFKDTNGDGVGDLPGITEKLDYIAGLGVDGVWISPFFKSPMKDFGYDVSDYRDVDPLFGTLADFRALLDEAHARGLKIIVDLVLSHTSDQHPWFAESRLSRDNEKAGWYVWADPAPDGNPPNNWLSVFGGPAWSYDMRRGQYYYHQFLREQPDLNLHTHAVQDMLLDTARFWLEFGVDGFRLDACNHYFHDAQLRSNPPRSHAGYANQLTFVDPYSMQAHIHDKSQPENFAFLHRLRALTNEFPGSFLLGEVGDDNPIRLAAQYTAGDQHLHTAYSFSLITAQAQVPAALREPIRAFLAEPGDAWPSWAFSNHDVVRSVSRWTDGRFGHSPQIAQILIGLLCSLRGTAFLYEGEELGLPEAEIPYERIQDPWGKFLWPQWQGRDGCRTPMPWDEKQKNCGFTAAPEPWLPIPQAHCDLAAATQDKSDESTLTFTREFLAWRKSHPALSLGSIEFLDSEESLFVFKRVYKDETMLCIFNCNGVAGSFPRLGVAKDVFEWQGANWHIVGERIMLPGFGFFIGQMQE